MTGSTEPTNRGIDALLPAEIARKAETVGVQKTRRDILSLLALAVLAKAFHCSRCHVCHHFTGGSRRRSSVRIEPNACGRSRVP